MKTVMAKKFEKIKGEMVKRQSVQSLSGKRDERESGNINSELCNEFMPGWQIFISYWKNSRGGVLTQLGLRSIH